MEKQGIILIGEIYREHGIQGRVRVYIYSHDGENFRQGMKVLLKNSAGVSKEVLIQEAVPYQKWFLTKFSSFSSPDDVKTWRKAQVFISQKDLKKSGQGEAYIFELIGFVVCDLKGKEIGTIQEVRGAGLTALFVLEGAQGREVLIPVVPQWIISRDKKGKKIVMNLPEGLI